MAERYIKETILFILGIISICGGSCLFLNTLLLTSEFPYLSLRRSFRTRPDLWIAAVLLMILGFSIFLYLWRDIVMLKYRKRTKRKDTWKLK